MQSDSDAMPTVSNRLHPSLTVGEAGIGHAAYKGANIELLAERLFAHFQNNPEDMGLLLDVSVALQLAHRREDGLAAQREALARQRFFRVCGAEGPPQEPCLHLLAIVAPGDLMTNTPLEFITAHIPVRLDLLFVTVDSPLPQEVPDHDLAFIAVSQSEDREALLHRLVKIVQDWPRPTVQDPLRILGTSRERVYRALCGVPWIVMPAVVRATRRRLLEVAGGERSPDALGENLCFPLLVRPLDSHAGKKLARITDAASLAGYLDETDDAIFHVTQYFDYAGGDANFRKYRIALIEGRPFLCHMAISEKWMVHYANAGMVESAEKRAEEARTMEHFDESFAMRHVEAFREIYEHIGLEYLGIDCGEMPDGRLLVFEIDAAMVIHAMDPPEIFPYKQGQMRKVFTAFYKMLAHAAGGADFNPPGPDENRNDQLP